MLYAYAIGILIAGILNTFFGIAVFLKNRKAVSNIVYGLLSLAIVIWCYSWFAMLLVDNNDGFALFFARLLNFGAVFIPVFYFHWILSLINLDKNRKKNLLFAYILTFIFAILSWTPYYIKGVHSILFFPYWPSAGFFYILYLVFGYIIFSGYGVYLLLKHFPKFDYFKKNQIKYVILGSLMGFGGGAVNFFLMYKINPFGSFGNVGIFVSLGLFIPFTIPLTYATIKYRLMDIKIVFTEIMAVLVAITLFIDFIFSLLSSGFILSTIFKLVIFFIFAYLGILLIRGVLKEIKQREQMEKMAWDIRRAYEIEKKAKEELQRLDDAKTQFTMATQHHLRTPLTSMRGYIDLIMTGTYGKIPPKLKDPLEKFEISTKRLIKIVNEFLDISQFQLGKQVVSLKPGVKIEPIIKEIIEELKFEVDSKKLYLMLEKPDNIYEIKADEEKLKVALFNLIDNAVKYTPKGGVRITISDGDKIEIRIKDTGIGIAKQDIPQLFGRTFERGKEAKRVFTTGRGIGLYITGEIIKAHNGRIWVESDGLGMGSTFHVELPVG